MLNILKSVVLTGGILILGLTLSASYRGEAPGASDELSTDSIEADKKRHIEAVLATIKGKENKPADSVYKNIKLLKGMPAGRVLRIMDIAYSKSLGVSCGHCHDTKDWASDTKKPKLITREMWHMMGRINNELLKGITQLDKAAVNCTTCHRGKVKPALSLD